MGESAVDTKISDLEKLSNPTVGLCAHPGIVDIRITAKANSESIATIMLMDLEKEISRRLPGVIFGIDDLSLPMAIENLVCTTGLKILIGLTGFSTLDDTNLGFGKSESISILQKDFSKELAEIQVSDDRSVVFGINLLHTKDVSSLNLFYSHEKILLHEQRLFNGPSSIVETWAANTALGYLWKKLSALYPGEKNEKS
jgi:hypothetical protein